MTQDQPRHVQVCAMLQCIRQAAELRAADAEEAAEGEGEEDGGKAPPAAAKAEPLRPLAEALGEGWAHVLPERYAPVYPLELAKQDAAPQPSQSQQQDKPEAVEAANGAEAKGAEPPRKRARRAKAEEDDAPASAAATVTPAAAAEPKALDERALLRLAVELADRTSALSYAYTAAHALRTLPAAKTAVASTAAAARPLQLIVLGAAGDAELADPSSWQVVADAVDTDVRIVFVGPEVPDSLAGTGAQYGRVSQWYLQSTYGDDSLTAAAERTGQAAVLQHPDAFLAFNPGFTCPDYEWVETLAALSKAVRPGQAQAAGGGRGPCLIVATNTRLEADMENDMLREQGWVAVSPSAPNPFTSLKAQQNGVYANDCYRKNAWLSAYSTRQANQQRQFVVVKRRQGKAAAKLAAAFGRIGKLFRKRR
ncbi:hypothetical protein HYH03_002261 [Edaphochlamys debaryana]|uniref:Mitochondrial splicing suppressor 51-like C-terminal domain-containing protein n=1 Tax=Edaphochlamys debaryana TaxID=47281 RepID=A0A836C4B2_9CHLO|nr:hypothetical protein HYH03_002261 [Edaphochlamys debaryana]|eukprot:KAG2499976.1 hypothetical protein HYH03_002261 [Edaphochlamys debaryana]